MGRGAGGHLGLTQRRHHTKHGDVTRPGVAVPTPHGSTPIAPPSAGNYRDVETPGLPSRWLLPGPHVHWGTGTVPCPPGHGCGDDSLGVSYSYGSVTLVKC